MRVSRFPRSLEQISLVAFSFSITVNNFDDSEPMPTRSTQGNHTVERFLVFELTTRAGWIEGGGLGGGVGA